MHVFHNETFKHCLFLTYYETKKTSPLVGISIALSVWNALLLVVATIANGLVCSAILRNRELRTTWNTLIALLSASDFLVGVVVQPMYLLRRLLELHGQYTCWVVLTYRVLWHLSIGTSFLILCLIACERYIALFFPFKYKELVTISRILYFTGFVVTSWTIFVISRFLGLGSGKYYAAATSFIVTFVSLIVFAYVRIFRLARRHQSRIRTLETSAKDIKERKLTKTTAYIVSSVLACYTPLLLSIVVVQFFDKHFFQDYVFPVTDCMVFSNSSLNPMIYCWRNAELRRCIAKLLKIRGTEELQLKSNTAVGRTRKIMVHSENAEL